jgi:hypothetical protein
MFSSLCSPDPVSVSCAAWHALPASVGQPPRAQVFLVVAVDLILQASTAACTHFTSHDASQGLFLS